MLPAAIAGLAFWFAIFAFLTLHSPLDVRVILAGVYLLIGTVAVAALEVLFRLNSLVGAKVRGGGK